MSERVSTPWHVWIVAMLTLLWNAFGAVDYVMTQTRNEAYLAAFTEEQLEYFFNMPFGYELSWAIAIWTSVLGSIFMLLRMKLAVPTFLLSTICFLVGALYSYIFYPMPGAEVGHMLFSALIFVVLVFTLWYSWVMSKAGVLK